MVCVYMKDYLMKQLLSMDTGEGFGFSSAQTV
jgi:hypothetical protein